MKKNGKLQRNIGTSFSDESTIYSGLPMPLSKENNTKTENTKLIIPKHSKQKLLLRNLTAIGAQSEFNISLKNNMVFFKSSEDYRKIIDNLTVDSEREIADIVTSLKHKSYSHQFNNANRIAKDNPYKNTILELLLNEGEAMHIGEHVYKIDPKSERVYVIDSKRSFDYIDLYNQNIANSRITPYNTNLDVIVEVEEPAMWCSASYAPPKQQTSYVWYSPSTGVTKHQSMAKYFTLGIYFKLFGEISANTSKSAYGSTPFEFVFDLGLGYIHWKERCGSMADFATITSGTKSGGSNPSTTFTTYQGSKGLTNFFFQFWTRDVFTNTYPYGTCVVRHNW